MTDSRKTAIVTGASQGIGAALVEEYLKRGYAVVANSRNIAKTNSLPRSASLALIDGDIGDPKTAEKVVGAALSRFWSHRSGILISKPFTEYTTEDLNALVSTTMAGFLYLSQRVVKEMVNKRMAASSAFRQPSWTIPWPVYR